MTSNDGLQANQYTQLTEEENTGIEDSEEARVKLPRGLCRRAAISDNVACEMMNPDADSLAMTFSPDIVKETYLPSIASFDTLTNINIKELRLNVHHRGHFILVRTAASSPGLSSTRSMVEDVAGEITNFELSVVNVRPNEPVGKVLQRGEIMIIKEPYFRLLRNNRNGIQLDHLADIIWLSDDDHRIPPKWRIAATQTLRSAVQLKSIGNEMVQSGRFGAAVEIYSEALQCSPTPEEAEIIHNNRAHANLRLEAYDAALEDASYISKPGDRSEKALYRGYQALYHLERYQESARLLSILIRKLPGCTKFTNELSRVQQRLEEQRNGQYDFERMYAAAIFDPPNVDCASFTGPITLRSSAERGRSLFTTHEVRSGDLLLCEKAFAHCAAGSTKPIIDRSPAHAITLAGLPSNMLSCHADSEMIRGIVVKLQRNPSLIPAFTNLYGGSSSMVSKRMVDSLPIFDIFSVAKIISLNCFSCPLTSLSEVTTLAQNSRSRPSDSFSGIWLQAAMINHSCLFNVSHSFIGDMLIVRAADDLPAGTELLLPYRNFSSSAEDSTPALRWDIRCTCALCQDNIRTSQSTENKRVRISFEIKTLVSSSKTSRPDAIIKRLLALLGELSNTYSQPATIVPRHRVFHAHLLLLSLLSQCGDAVALIQYCLATLSSVGFLIEGAGLPARKRGLRVHRWGVAVRESVQVWRLLWGAYGALGEAVLREQAREMGRIGWLMQVGEDPEFNHRWSEGHFQ